MVDVAMRLRSHHHAHPNSHAAPFCVGEEVESTLLQQHSYPIIPHKGFQAARSHGTSKLVVQVHQPSLRRLPVKTVRAPSSLLLATSTTPEQTILSGRKNPAMQHPIPALVHRRFSLEKAHRDRNASAPAIGSLSPSEHVR